MTRLSCSVLVALTMAMLPATTWAQTCNTADRSVLLILDASGSMNAKLPNGETRIAVAQRAIKGVAGFVPAQAQLSLRLYGAQSPASQKNCQDTHLAVPFGPASASGGAITTTVDGAKAQGYTPIAYSLGTGRERFSRRRQGARHRAGQRRQGDLPGRSGGGGEGARGQGHHRSHRRLHRRHRGARAAAGHRARHRRHLFRRAGRAGTAGHAQVRVRRLQEARRDAAAEAAARQAAHDVGRLTSHDIINAETGQKVATFDRVQTQVELPAGIYEVKFGPGSWKGIEVRSGETTTIAAGRAEGRGHACLSTRASSIPKPARSMERFDNVSTKVTLMPGVYDLQFRKAVWRFVKVDGGKTTTLRPAAVILARRPEVEVGAGHDAGRNGSRSASTRSPRRRRCRRATTSSRWTATSSRSPRPKAKCSR